LMVIRGYSGIGKSSIVNELHKSLAPSHGLFASGKFDQLKRDVPYVTVTQAVQGLIRGLLGKSSFELEDWRRALSEALGAQGRLLVELMPELKLISGEHPDAPDLPPQQARRLFQIALRRLIGVFATPDHPLALFLDDLQWVDAATLDLLEDLMVGSELRPLLVIVAYRDNEVASTHPLVSRLESIRQAGAKVGQITLSPLGREHLEKLVTDAFHCSATRAISLAQVLHEKTGGNPFFAVRFLSALAEEGLIAFDTNAGAWLWDLDRIRAERYTDNVAELIVGRLGQLPDETQAALQTFACFGNTAQINVLSTIFATSEEHVHSMLWEAVRHDMVERRDGSYKFTHDRVQEAAYSLIPKQRLPELHLHIGRLLAAQSPSAEREETIFDIVNHLNRGAELIDSREEREDLAKLNLVAGKRAMASTAFPSALTYFMTGASLLPTDSRVRRHELAFALEVRLAECEFLTGDTASAADRLTTLSFRAANTAELAAVAALRIDLYTTLDQCDQAVAACIGYLQNIGVDWSAHPTKVESRHEYQKILAKIGGRTIEELTDLPLMSDGVALATLDVLTRVFPSALFIDANLLSLAVCRAINLSLELGHGEGSCVAYVFFGKIAGPQFDDYKAGFRFGQLGYELIEKRGLERFRARAYLWFAQFSLTWTKRFDASRALLWRAFEAATKVGDLTFAVYSFDNLITNYLAAGDPLAETQRQAERGLELAERAQFDHMIDTIKTQLGVVRSLRGLTRNFGSFDDGQVNEAQLERRLAATPATGLPECWYWIRKLQALFFAGDYSSALEAAEKARKLLWTSAAMFEMAEYHLYAALARAAAYPPAFLPHDGRRSRSSDLSNEVLTKTPPFAKEDWDDLTAHHRQLEVWAENCPENFADRAALVGAEIARIEGRELDAQRLYERAIDSARAADMVHNEALANELAGRFYLARGFERIANAYFREARDRYSLWGADGKVQQLDRLYPHLAAAEGRRHAAVIGSPIQHLDVATVVKASQAVSSEIELPKLIERLMRIALENAGANRGLLILPARDDYLIRAEARATGDEIQVVMRQEPMTSIACPETLLRYVIRTHESVILDDASKPNLFSTDDYLRQSKSIICVPLIKQRELIGVLLLENVLTSHAFTSDRIAVLELLAGQAAISLENTRLYGDLQEREAKIRRLVDSNIIGILIGNPDGDILEANQALLRIIGYDQADVAAGRLRRTELTPSEWHDRDARALAEMRKVGTVQPFEKEYFRKDGSRAPVLIGGATLDERGDTVVIFVIDLTERKRAEAELAHANRVATMGQLTASIAHEVNQPLAGLLMNAATAGRSLAEQPPNLERAKLSIDRIARDGKRAASILSRIRDFSIKAPARKERLEINEAILDIIGLASVPMSDGGVVAKVQLAEGLPRILGDRVQLQQVVLNLIMNAIEAMSEVPEGQRELSISTKVESEGVLVAVSDSGPGVPQASATRIFDAFYTTKPAGLGMGLSICRSIVEAHEGQLWASPNIPRGAVLQFTMPTPAD
jgi:PAS domain S-box-containing protein